MGAVIGRLKRGWSLVMRTKPILIYRLGVYAAFAAAAAIYFLIFAGLAYLFGSLGWIIVLIALGGFGGLWYWARRYLLYMIRAAHVAVMTELIQHDRLPEGVSQYEYGKKIITDNFKNVSILFAIDALVDGVLKAFTRTVARIVDLLPLPGIENLAAAGMQIVDRSMTYVDEAIFSYGLTKRNEQSLWASAKDGVILYAQCWKELLKLAVGIWIVGAVSFFVLLVLFLIPGILIALAIPQIKLAIGVIVLAAAYIINLALYEPAALAAMILAFHEETKDQEPDPVWDERLTQATNKFQELKDKAAESMKGWVAPSKEGAAQDGEPGKELPEQGEPASEEPADTEAKPETGPEEAADRPDAPGNEQKE